MKKILITGSCSGLALDVINKLLDKDYYIYATTHTIKEANRMQKQYLCYTNIEWFKLDVKNDSDIKKIDDLDIDILLSNAAISYGGNLLELDIAKMRDNYEVNVFSNLKIIQKVIMKDLDNSPKIIIMASLAGIIPLKFIGSYASTKASLIKIGEILDKEVKMINKNIKISIIEPGIYLTGFNRFMFLNKYDGKSIYAKYTDKIMKEEEFILKILGQKHYDSITNKIVKAINSNNPHFIYRAPLFQVIGAKMYSLFKQ